VKKPGSLLFRAVIAMSLFAFVPGKLFAASSTLQDYFFESAKILPDNFAIGLSETVKFNDNINKGTRSKSHSAWEFNSDVNIDVYKTLSNMTYGIGGSLGWNHYHNGNRSAEPDIDLSPYFNFDQALGNLMLGGGVTYKDESLSSSDRRYAKYFDTFLQAAYDLNAHERYGMLISGDYNYRYYKGSEFHDKNYAKYGLSLAPYYVLSPKTKAGLRLGYEQTDYRNRRLHDDLEEIYLNLFVNYQVSLKLNMTAEAGGTRSRYKSGSSRGSNGDDKISANYRLGMNYNLLSNLIFHLSLLHKPEDSFELEARGLSQTNESYLGMTWIMNPKLRLHQQLGFIFKDERNSSWDHKQFEYDLNLSYALRERLHLNAGYTYTTTHFKYEDDSNYKSNEVSLGVSWQF